MKKFLEKFIIFFIVTLSITLFATEESGVPNEIIKDNPKREVTTVESMKVRDKATMSLSITKVTPEEIMGVLKDGKLSVYIEKNVKKLPENRMSKIDVSKLKLKAYSNPKIHRNPIKNMRAINFELTEEDIKNLMRYDSKTNEKKITVIENNDEYVRLDVEGVTQGEKVYISVMNGNRVVKSYRIGEVVASKEGETCWETKGEILETKAERESFKVVTGGIETRIRHQTDVNLFDKNSGVNGFKLTHLDESTGGLKNSLPMVMITTDEFFEGKHSIEGFQLGKNYGFRLVVANVLGNNLASAVAISGGYDGVGNRIVENLNFNSGENNLKFGNISDDEVSPTFRKLEKIGQTVSGDTCDAIRPENEDKRALEGEIKLGFYMDMTIPKDKIIPGVFKYENGMEIEISRKGREKDEKFTANFNVDVGEENGGNATLLHEADSTSANGISITFPTKLMNEKHGLSLMYKSGNDRKKGGIWLGENDFFSIKENRSGEVWTEEKTITSTNGSGASATIQLFQRDGGYAELIFTPKGVSSETDTEFKFTLWQGRASNGTNLDKKFKKVDYTIKYTKMDSSGNVKIEIDPRLNQLASSTTGSLTWMTLNNRFGKWNEGDKKSYPDLINTTGKFIGVDTVAGASVSGKQKKDENEYFIFYDEGRNKVAIRKNQTIENLDKNSNFMVDSETETKYDIYFVKGDNLKKYYSTLDITFAKGVKQAGYSGSGKLDMSTGKTDTWYSFSAPIGGGNNSTSSPDGLTMTVTGDFPNTNGVIANKKDTSIATEFEVTGNGATITSQTGEGIGNKKAIIGKNDGQGDLEIELTSENKLKIKKLSSEFDYTGENKLTLTYKYKNGNDVITLGKFDLEINSTRITKNIGTVTVNIDERFTQLANDFSWIGLNGNVSNFTNSQIGNYIDFIDVSGSFTDYDGGATINSIEEINDSTSISDATPNFINATYKKLGTSSKEKDEAAFPYKKNSKTPLTMEEFVKTGSDSLLVISKFDIKQSGYNGENKFTLLATTSGTNRATEEVNYTGNLQEIYKTKSAISIFPILDSSKTAYAGTGSLNLAKATIDKVYTFTAGATGDITSGSGAEQITLEISSGKSLDATGIFNKNNTKNIANKVIISDGKGREIVRSNNKFETNISNDSVKIGINEQGQLFIQKLKEENIDSIITIDYYYSLDNNSTVTSDKDIKLGSFTLVLKNQVVGSYDTNKMTVKIDKRFADATNTPVWLLKGGKAIKGIGDKVDENNKIDYTNLFKYEGSFTSKESGSIVKAIGVEGRKVKMPEDDYDIFIIDKGKWPGEAAIPNKGDMGNLENIVVVSKNNDDGKVGLENKFSLVYGENGNEKVYKGNLLEVIVGDGKTTGDGKIKIDALEKGITYKFEPSATGSGEENSVVGKGEGTPERTVTMTDVTKGEKLPDGKGVTDISSNVIANKIVVTENGGTTTFISGENQKTTTVGDYTFGISNEGGLTLKREDSATSSESKNFTIKFYYSPQDAQENLNGKYDVELSTFTLILEKTNFEIDGDGVLDFGNLFYRKSAPTETRIKEFKVKNPEMKNIDFKVENTSEMRLKDEGATESDKIDLKDIGVKKMSNTSFELSATAVLTDETKSGVYEGTIEVTVTISDSKK